MPAPEGDQLTGAASLDPAGGPASNDRPHRVAQALPALTPVGRVRLAAEVLSTYGTVRWHLWRSDLRTTVRALRGRASGSRMVEPSDETHEQGSRLSRATTRTLALLPTDSRCLMQSLVLLGLLSRRSIGGVLVVAVKSGPDFKAHAWVEHNQRPLLPSGDFGRLLEL